MEELLSFLEASVFQLPCSLCGIQHDQGSQHVGLYKDLRIFDASVHMAFRRKMHHSVDVIFFENLIDLFRIADICLNKRIVISILDIF